MCLDAGPGGVVLDAPSQPAPARVGEHAQLCAGLDASSLSSRRASGVVVIALNPGDGDVVELVQGERFDALEHRHEAAPSTEDHRTSIFPF